MLVNLYENFFQQCEASGELTVIEIDCPMWDRSYDRSKINNQECSLSRKRHGNGVYVFFRFCLKARPCALLEKL